MLATLTIYQDGEEVHRTTVETRAEIFDVLAKFPPPSARGSVATLTADGYAPTTFLSGHSNNGPRWNLHR